MICGNISCVRVTLADPVEGGTCQADRGYLGRFIGKGKGVREREEGQGDRKAERKRLRDLGKETWSRWCLSLKGTFAPV